MSDTEYQAKGATPDDIVMEEEDAPITDGQEPVPAADEEPAAEETEAKESNDKAASPKKDTASKPKSKTSQPAKKGNGTSSRKMAGKIAKADAKADSKDTGKFKVGDLVTGRVKGFPFWPAVVVDPDTVPSNVTKQRPRGSNIICIQYMTDGQYSWFPPTPSNVRPLPKHEIDAYLKSSDSKKTSGGLYQAYECASHPKQWIADQDEHRRALAAGGAESEDEAAEDEDELAEDGEDGEPAAKTGGKRKRATAEVKKPTKKETASKKAKTDKAPAKKSARKDAAEDNEEPVSKKASTSKAAANKKAPASSSKKAAAPTSAAKETKESKEAKEDAGDDALDKDPEASKVRDWRHKLQRAFLSKSVPAAEEMDNYDNLFTTIENYQNMTVAYLAHSKIGKVMKKIAALTNIPRNDDLKITDRAHALMQKWTDQIDNGKPADAVGNGDVATKGTEAADEDKPTNDAPVDDGKMDVDGQEATNDEDAEKEAAPVDA